MARDGKKKTAKRPSVPKGRPEGKKPFWSYFFEPIPEEEDAGLFDDDPDFDRPYGEPPRDEPDGPLFDDAELVYSAAEDAAAAAKLTWSDGERVIPDAPFSADAAPGGPDGLPQATPRAEFPAQPLPYVPLGTPVPTADNPYVPLGTPIPTTDNPYVPLGTPIPTADNPYVPLGTPIPTADNPYVPLDTPVPTAGNPYVPLDTPVPTAGNSYAPFSTSVPTADNPYVPFDTPIPTADSPYAPFRTPIPTVDNPYVPPAAGDDDDGTPQDEDAEDIRLFDEVADAEDARSHGRGQTTRLFRTGTGATTRIHINETEDALRMEEAARRSRAREAKRKHEAARERQNKRKKRTTILRKLFANVAFVLFFIVAVVVALYYGFLLSDVVVLGNNTYSTDYIIGLSGLKLGTHMLFCDLDGAADNIRQDPYIQVDQVNYIFPSRIRIVVSERKEVAGIIGLDYNVIIDDQGYVLSMSGGTDISDLLQVTGVSTTGFQLGQQLGEGNDLGTATLVQIIDKLEEYELMNAVKSIDMTTPLAITFTASNGLNVHLGQSTDLDNKFSTFSRLLPQFLSQNIYEGTLYLSAKGGAVYSPAGAAQAAAAQAGDVPEETAPIDETLPGEGDQGATPVDGATDLAPIDGGEGTGDALTSPTATLPPATPTPYNPGGSSDEFQG